MPKEKEVNTPKEEKRSCIDSKVLEGFQRLLRVGDPIEIAKDIEVSEPVVREFFKSGYCTDNTMVGKIAAWFKKRADSDVNWLNVATEADTEAVQKYAVLSVKRSKVLAELKKQFEISGNS